MGYLSVAVILAFAAFTAEGFKGCNFNSKIYRNKEVIGQSTKCGIKLICNDMMVQMVPLSMKRSVDENVLNLDDETASFDRMESELEKAGNGNLGCWFNGRNWKPRSIVAKKPDNCCFMACVNRARNEHGKVLIFNDPNC